MPRGRPKKDGGDRVALLPYTKREDLPERKKNSTQSDKRYFVEGIKLKSIRRSFGGIIVQTEAVMKSNPKGKMMREQLKKMGIPGA